ncbi:MAG: ATP-binding protein [Fidelibacterota bacterium]
METEKKIEIKTSSDIILARQSSRDLANKLGFGSADQTRLATAISELTRNVVQYAGVGRCTIQDISNKKMGIRVVVEDTGNGIENIEKAMEDGYSTGSGMGMGLPAAKRLVTKFNIQSKKGQTKVTVEMVRLRR